MEKASLEPAIPETHCLQVKDTDSNDLKANHAQQGMYVHKITTATSLPWLLEGPRW
jgi:hypothetical protein